MHLLGVAGVLAASQGNGLGVAIWSVFGNTIDAFFMISAFVLFLPAVRRAGAFGGPARFWIGRGARLLPAFWLVVVLILVLVGDRAAGGRAMQFPSATEIVAHLTVMQMPVYFFDPDSASGSESTVRSGSSRWWSPSTSSCRSSAAPITGTR